MNGSLPSEVVEGDVVIAGGGTTACVIAARLAEALPDLQIIIVESGADNRDDERVSRPLDGMFRVYEGASEVRYIQSTPSEHLDGRGPVVPVGNILGGSSSINFMMYNNASGSDFDDWQQPGWTFEELKPVIRKIETYNVADITRDDDVHGTEGPIPVSRGGHRVPYAEDYFRAMKLVKNVPRVEDIADYKTGHGCSFLAKLIDPKTGRRANAAHSYLYDRGHASTGSNIRILTHKTVVRVTFDGTRASGLEVCDTPRSPLDEAVSGIQQVKARKLVLVCGGAFGTPTILERSGIGKSDFLEGLGIDVVVDLPGVGKEYQDHELTICSYHAAEDTETLDEYPRGEAHVKAAADAEFKRTGGGLAASNGFDFAFKVRPTAADIQEMGPIFESHWKEVALNKPDKPLYSGPLVPYFMGPTPRPASGRYFSLGAFLNCSVHITSANPHVPPSFDAGLLTHPADLPVHVWAYKMLREVARRLPMYRGEYAPSHPSFAPDSTAACVSVTQNASPDQVQSLSYSSADDAAIESWVRKTVGTAYHSMSTCPMRPRESDGVVDGHLNVYGVQGLKVADLSICPSNLGTNTTTVALIIGEKAAQIVVEELRGA
ncbi:hypothetical protein EHS25_004005 [Saitozyma podzolica]|uniref:Glucose-methanol-choline oxidoreductase N-terminal domain-containing protein n=1 Tax=Saitozyma podzolica TaxID=1890683 RepID=A0A427YSZ2_9TREE|nr:hypothetical protein EHS25_004005 [Saitozyma podzolica]